MDHSITHYSQNSDRKIVALLDNPCTTFWLRDALLAALQRDPVDSLNDAELLQTILKERNDEITKYFSERYKKQIDS